MKKKKWKKDPQNNKHGQKFNKPAVKKKKRQEKKSGAYLKKERNKQTKLLFF